MFFKDLLYVHGLKSIHGLHKIMSHIKLLLFCYMLMISEVFIHS